MSELSQAREEICKVGASIFQRGLTFGSTGNISVRLRDGGYLMTPEQADERRRRYNLHCGRRKGRPSHPRMRPQNEEAKS